MLFAIPPALPVSDEALTGSPAPRVTPAVPSIPMHPCVQTVLLPPVLRQSQSRRRACGLGTCSCPGGNRGTARDTDPRARWGSRACGRLERDGERRLWLRVGNGSASGSVRLDPQAASGRIPARSGYFPEPTMQPHAHRLDSLLGCPIPPRVSLHPAPPTPPEGSWRHGVASPIPAVPLPSFSPPPFLTHNPVSFLIPSNVSFLTRARNRSFLPRSSYASTGLSLSCHSDAHPASAPFPSRPVPREAHTQHVPGTTCLSMRLSRASASPLRSLSPPGLASAIFYCCSRAALGFILSCTCRTAPCWKGNSKTEAPTVLTSRSFPLDDPQDRLLAPTTTPYFLISLSELRINYLAARGKHQECLKHAELRL
ncbi:uncharacterized protein LOC129203795 isoform X1 [Grus americana]|uniref:uncharacterized protein LOC129203795 isoform X1 n=1 Tax=Grus americana TaxID=9117 RepID=UPI002407CADF|nr:uncharacterized protein LOC129203795 isoform X1 [Grus americana]